MKRDKSHRSDANDSKDKIKDNLAVDAENVNQSDNSIDSDTPEEKDDYTLLKEEHEELCNKYDELNDSFLRLTAEFDNFRKRTLKEKSDIIKSGGEKVLSGIIPLVDDFERALESMRAAEDKDALVEGMDLIYSKFINFLKQNGVDEIEAVGLPFDADSFEAVTTVPVQDESQKGVVIDCVQKGYKLNDKIIRFPKVVVGE